MNCYVQAHHRRTRSQRAQLQGQVPSVIVLSTKGWPRMIEGWQGWREGRNPTVTHSSRRGGAQNIHKKIGRVSWILSKIPCAGRIFWTLTDSPADSQLSSQPHRRVRGSVCRNVVNESARAAPRCSQRCGAEQRCAVRSVLIASTPRAYKHQESCFERWESLAFRGESTTSCARVVGRERVCASRRSVRSVLLT